MALKCFTEAFQRNASVHTLLLWLPSGQQDLAEAPMIALFIPAAVLLIAVLGSALFNPAPREKQ